MAFHSNNSTLHEGREAGNWWSCSQSSVIGNAQVSIIKEIIVEHLTNQAQSASKYYKIELGMTNGLEFFESVTQI